MERLQGTSREKGLGVEMSYPNKPENNGWVDEDYEEMSEDDLEYQRDSYNDYSNYL